MGQTSTRLAAVLIAAGVFAAGCGDDKTTDAGGATTTAKTGAPLTVCSDIPYEPMEFEDAKAPSGFTGFDIDLAQAFADGASRKLVVKVTPFDGIFAALNAKQCDAIVSSVTITDERKKNVAFTEPYFDSDQSLMVRKADKDTYKTVADLAGKKFGVQSGTTGETYANDHKPAGSTIVALPGAADLFAKLESKEIDAVLQDLPINGYRATKNDQVVVNEKIKTGEQYGMAVRTDDAATLKLLNDGLAKAKSDGLYEKTYVKYFGSKPGS